MISLPRIHAGNLVRAMAIAYLVFCGLYLGAAQLHWREPLVLRPGVLDAAIPFLPWSIWVYLSQFALLPASIVKARNDADRGTVLYAMLAATALAAAVFVLWPTTLPRPAVPAGGATGIAWTLLHAGDTAYNCFPSLHVALAAIAGAALWRAGHPLLALLWPPAIALSTVTTRQHVVLDVLAGLLLAAAAWSLVSLLVRHERSQPAHHPSSA